MDKMMGGERFDKLQSVERNLRDILWVVGGKKIVEDNERLVQDTADTIMTEIEQIEREREFAV
jgi:hypothetical protein